MSVDKRQVLDQAQKLLDKGLIDRAIKQYLRLLEVEPDDVFVLQKIASLHAKNGSHVFALEFYERAFKVFKDKGFHEKCVGTLKRLIEIASARLDFHHELAKCQIALGRVREASTTLKSLIGVYERRGERDSSLRMLRELVRITPEDWTNRARLAEGYATAGKDILAVGNFKQVLATLIQENRLDDHARIAERLLFLYPDESDVAIELARNYLSRNLQGKALNWLHILFKEDPKNHLTLELLGDVFVIQDRLDKALAVFKEAKRLLSLAGDVKGQTVLAQKIARLDPNANVVESDSPQVIALTSRHPTALEPELAPDLLLSDVLILVEFGLWSHALKRIQSLPGDFTPQETHFPLVSQLAKMVEQIEHEGLRAEVETLVAYIDTSDIGNESSAPDGGTATPSTPEQNEAALEWQASKADSKAETALNLNDDVDLDEIDFSEYEDLESAADEEEFGFEVDFESEADLSLESENSSDDFADLLGSAPLRKAEESDTITPPAPASIMDTRERFPLIRPDKNQLPFSSDKTSEVSVITGASGRNVEETRARSEETVVTEADEDFGGLLDSDDD